MKFLDMMMSDFLIIDVDFFHDVFKLGNNFIHFVFVNFFEFISELVGDFSVGEAFCMKRPNLFFLV